MTKDYSVNFSFVSKGGLDTGEVGGFSETRIFETLKGVKDFASAYLTAQDYRSMSYSERKCQPNNTLFFLSKPQIFERTLLFDRKNFKKGMSIPKFNGSYHFYEMHGKYKKYRDSFYKTEGHFCYSGKTINEPWASLKHKNTESGQLFGFIKLF